MTYLKKTAFGLVIILMWLDFYSVGSAMTPVRLPACYGPVQKDLERGFAILEIPWDGGRYLMTQTIHKIPIVQGYLGRRLERALIDRLPFDPRAFPTQKKMLIENHVKYLILFKKRLDWDAEKQNDREYAGKMTRAAAVYGKFYAKIYEDDGAVTFKVY